MQKVGPVTRTRPATVGIVSSEPITDPILIANLEAGDLRCLRIEPHRGKAFTLRRIAQCDVLLKNFGAYSSRPRRGFLKLFAAAKILSSKVVVYWIGTDVLRASGPRRFWAKLVQLLVDKNLTVTLGLRDELSDLGIESELIPIVGNLSNFELAPLPEQFTVLTYLPELLAIRAFL